MRRLLIFILFTFSLNLSASSLEEEVGLIHDRVDLKLRLMNTVIQTNQRLEIALGGLERAGYEHEEFNRRWALEFRAITEKYIEEQMRIGELSSSDKNVFRKFFKHLKWSELSELHLKTWRKLRPVARAKGVTLMGALVIVNILNYVVPYTLTMLGQPYLGAMIFAAPVNPPTVFVYQTIARIKLEIEMRKILGGSKGVRAYRALDREVRNALSLKSASDFISGAYISEDQAVRVRAGGIIDTVVRLFGLRKNDLSLAGLRRFLKEEDALSPIYQQLLSNRDLSEPERVSMMITELSKEEGELFSKFKMRFSASLVNKPRAPLELIPLENWALKVLSSKSTEDIFYYIKNVPQSVHPYHLLTTWEQIILPGLAHGEQLSYKQMRALSKRFQGLRLKKELFLSELTFEGVREDLLEYFRSGVSLNRKSCYHTPGEVIEQLLKAH